MYGKEFTYKTASGTEALILALRQLGSSRVIIPTYTCTDIYKATIEAGCEPVIVDCGLDLQIDFNSVLQVSESCDTVIVPHMFGIRADIEAIRKHTTLKIIEDLSQCHGLEGLGTYADIIVTSTNKSKWVNFKGGGVLFTDHRHTLPHFNFEELVPKIQVDLNRRIELAEELINAGVKLIGQESSWLRGMYFAENAKRKPYIPLHVQYGEFACPKVNSYIDKVDWISIII